MEEGVVIGMYITEQAGGEMNSVDSISAVENCGIIGDRYYQIRGTFSKAAIEPDQEITLIEAEAFERLNETHGIQLNYADCRRNIVTRNVDLNALVGKTFSVGGVTLTGMRLCEPCRYLSEVTGHPNLVKQWLHQAGLRAHIAKSGRIEIGDKVIV